MKFLLSESQLGRTQRMIIQSIQKVGLINTMKKFNLNLTGVGKILKDVDLEIFDWNAGDISDMIVLLIKDELIDTSHFYDDITISLSTDREYYVTLEIDVFKNEKLVKSFYGYATPFLEGSEMLPIEINEESKNPEYINFNKYIDTPLDFKTFNDFATWTQKTFPKIIYDETLELTKKEG